MTHIGCFLGVLWFLAIQRPQAVVAIAFHEVCTHVFCCLLVYGGVFYYILGVYQLFLEDFYMLIFAGQDGIFDFEFFDYILLELLAIIL